MRIGSGLTTCLLLLPSLSLGILAPRPLAAAPRLAVLILPSAPPVAALAEQATAVASESLVLCSGGEAGDPEELQAERVRAGSGDATACLGDADCRAEAATRLGFDLLLFGFVGQDAGKIRLSLQLVGTKRPEPPQPLFQSFPDEPGPFLAGLPELVAQQWRQRLGRVAIEGAAGATVLLDEQARGVAPLHLDEVPAGEHRVRVVHPRDGSWEETVEVLPGELLTLIPSLRPATPASPATRRGESPSPPPAGGPPASAPSASLRPWVYGLAAGGALLGGGGVLLNRLALKEATIHNDPAESRADRVAARSRGEDRWLAARLLYAGAGALVLAGGALLLREPSPRVEQSSSTKERSWNIALAPWVVPGAGGVIFTGELPR